MNMALWYTMSLLLTTVLLIHATYSQGTEPPLKPTSLRMTQSGDSILVSWAPPSTGPNIEGYRLGYGIGIADDHVVMLDANTHSYTIRNVDPDATYVISIRADNRIGVGPAEYKSIVLSRNEVEEEMETEPPLKPASLRVTQSGDSILVSWAPPSTGPNIEGYRLGYGIGIADEHVVMLDANTHSYTIRNVDPDATYVISIRADNRIGVGPAEYKSIVLSRNEVEEEMGTEPPLKPTSLRVTQSGDSILVSWAPPSTGPNIEGFRLGYGIGIADEQVVRLDANTRSYTIRNVAVGSTYHISIRAYNSVGIGPAKYGSTEL